LIHSALFGALGLVLAPFGAVDALLQKGPFHGFDSADPMLLVVRAERVPGVNPASCTAWLAAVAERKPGAAYTEKLAGWLPWDEDENKDIVNCDDLPCDVKLDPAETSRMKAAKESDRAAVFLKNVATRQARYLKTQERTEYEFPGDPVDPWKFLESRGFWSPIERPTKPALLVRQLDLAPGKFRRLRQVLDVRGARTATDAVSWIRDTYTDHYFDSWGEWAWAGCDAKAGTVTVVQALLVEFDLLKKTDLFSRIARPKMRDGVKDYGGAYLDGVFEELKSRSRSSR
jgi:hypothetical protein